MKLIGLHMVQYLLSSYLLSANVKTTKLQFFVLFWVGVKLDLSH